MPKQPTAINLIEYLVEYLESPINKISFANARKVNTMILGRLLTKRKMMKVRLLKICSRQNEGVHLDDY